MAEGLKIWGGEYQSGGIICPPPLGWDRVNWFGKIWGVGGGACAPHPLPPVTPSLRRIVSFVWKRMKMHGYPRRLEEEERYTMIQKKTKENVIYLLNVEKALVSLLSCSFLLLFPFSWKFSNLKEPALLLVWKNNFDYPKGQIKPKADWRAIDSSKKRANEFGFLPWESGNTWNLKSKFQVSSMSGL